MKKAAPIQSRFEAVLLDWRHLLARVPNVTVSLLTSLLCVIFGLIGIATSGKYFLGGVAFSIIGILRGAYCIRVFLLRRDLKRIDEEKRLVRKALLEARKERKLENRLEKSRLIELRRRAEELGKQAFVRRHDEKRAISLQKQLESAELEAVHDFEVKRLLKLSDSELLSEIAAIFGKLGFFPKSEGAEVESGVVLYSASSSDRTVYFCVPNIIKAGCEDVKSVAKMKSEAKATVAYLVSIAGFSEQSVVLSAKLSVSLVEAHLLADWKIRAGSKGDNRH